MTQLTNKWTGEVIDLPDKTPDEIREAWTALTETIKACETAKRELKNKISKFLDLNGKYDYGDYLFRQVVIQRQNYDKAVMRRVLDPDTFDLFLVPNKIAIDGWLKENVEQLGEVSTELRESMVPVGEPYTTLRLEKVV